MVFESEDMKVVDCREGLEFEISSTESASTVLKYSELIELKNKINDFLIARSVQ